MKLWIHIFLVSACSICMAMSDVPTFHDKVRQNDVAGVREILTTSSSLISAKNSESDTALHIAVRGNSHDMIRLLMQNGADLEARNKMGQTPLFVAVLHQMEWAIAILIQNKANLNVQDDLNGSTPLHQAVREDNTEITRMLLEAGANVHQKDHYGCTPYRVANRLYFHSIDENQKMKAVLREFGGTNNK